MKYLIFSLVLINNFILLSAEACKVDLSAVERIKNDPNISNNIFVGVVEKKWFEFYIRVERNWTQEKQSYLIDTFSDCSFSGYETGKKYLFLSTYDLKSEALPQPVIRLGSVFFMELSKARHYIDLLAQRRNTTVKINPSWQFCESDNECILSKNSCGKAISVNEKYEMDYLSFLKSKNEKAICSKGVGEQLKNTPESKCVDNFCS